MDSCASRFLLAVVAAGQRSLPTRQLFDAFQTPAGILRASLQELNAVEGLHTSTKKALLSFSHRSLKMHRPEALKARGIRLVSYECPEYPNPLRQIPDPPPVLFVRGRMLPEDTRALAVVGSRRAGAYGIAACERLVSGLVRQGFLIVSGMARGIDTVAHWSALEQGGRTAGVLGTGVDVTYPRSNAVLFERVPQQGFLVSELLPGTGARPENFPRRNRIISGLSLGVLVVEASERSGTMITVRLALEQGREVFAVPGDIRSPLSRGTHRLIQQGAKLAASVEDILEEFRHLGARPGAAVAAPGKDLHGEEDTVDLPVLQAGEGACPDGAGEDGDVVLGLLSDVGTGLDTLVGRTGWPVEKLSHRLTELELCGKIRRLPGNRFARSV